MPAISIIHLTDPQAWAIGAALALMAMDIVTGFASAVIKNEVSSSKMRAGLGHKALLVCLIALALMLEVAGSHITGLGFSGVTTVGVCVYIVIMEVASCCENICGAYPELADSPLMRIFDHESKKNGEARWPSSPRAGVPPHGRRGRGRGGRPRAARGGLAACGQGAAATGQGNHLRQGMRAAYEARR